MSITHKLPYEWQVGLRYTRAGKRSGRNSFISFISMASVAGIALGVAALIVVLSVMNGFQTEVTARMLSVLAHVEIFDANGQMPRWRSSAGEALRNPAVRAAAPFAEAQAMLLSDGVMKPVLLRGVDPAQEAKVSDVVTHMREGRFDAMQPGSYNIVIGRALAKSLAVVPGDRITLLMAASGPDAGPGTMPRTRPLTVSGIFEAGHFEFDSSLAFANIEDVQQLTGTVAPAGLRLRLDDMQSAPRVAAQLQGSMSGELFIRDWSKVNAMWFAAVQSQKRMMFIILTMIVAVAAFNLVSTLVMTVRDKQSDIAILRTLGASPRSIMTVFMVQGTLVGVLGALLGVSLGVVVALNIDVIVPFIERLFGVQFLSQEVYLISEIPSELRSGDVGWIGGMAVLLAFVATLYPSWSASRVNPAQALRYD
jgi:lipoprotein-releasing system permease protein